MWLFDNFGDANRKTVHEIKSWLDDQSSAIPSGPFPFQALRYVPSRTSSEDKGSAKLQGLDLVEGEFIGDLHLTPRELDGDTGNMMELPPKEQVWEVAYDILPVLRGRGIGKAMLKAGLEGWIQWLGIGTLLAVSRRSALGLFNH
jgi:RimJ/RimL family protein N-acetyltransferase